VGCIVTPRYAEKTANIGSEVSAERCILIDAVLVKIMKQRKREVYSEVISEVQKMCKTFKAEVAQIKMRIENCQQREFLERDANDMNLLIYKP
jgi:cullin 4